MNQLMTWGQTLADALHGFVMGPVMLAALLGVGVYFSIRTNFLQIRRLGLILRETILKMLRRGGRKAEKGSITPFQALSTALAGTLGVGNIAGVATAITLGGPGAVFWMWVSAFVGMMTKYAEVVLAVHYRERDENGAWVGGPMYYIKKGMGSKFLAGCFALFGMTASFGIGNMTQSNSIADALHTSFGVAPALTGTALTIVVGLVIIGGIRRIAQVSERIVPLMSIFYIVGVLIVIGAHFRAVPGAFAAIFEGAFGLTPAVGGITGALIARSLRFGVARGIFSNEAGLGSASIVHAAADTDHPARQGLWGAFEVFADTLVVCTMTAIAILASGLWQNSGLTGVSLSAAVFEGVLGRWGGAFLSLSVLFFAFASIVGWSYYGERCGCYLFGKRFLLPYRVVFVLAAAVGATMNLEAVWSIADTLNGLMAVPNLIALVILSGVVVSRTKEAFGPGGIFSPAAGRPRAGKGVRSKRRNRVFATGQKG